MQTYICIHTHIFIHQYLHPSIHVNIFTRLHIHVRINKFAYIHTYVNMEIPTHICKYCSLEQVVSNTHEFPLSFLLFLLAAHCYFGFLSVFLFFPSYLDICQEDFLHICKEKWSVSYFLVIYSRAAIPEHLCSDIIPQKMTLYVERWGCMSKEP